MKVSDRFRSFQERIVGSVLVPALSPVRALFLNPQVVFLIVFSGLLSLLLTPLLPSYLSLSKTSYSPGETVRATVRAPRNIVIEDLSQTEFERAQAERSVRRVFTIEGRGEEELTQLFRAISELHTVSVSEREAAKLPFERRFNVQLEKREWDVLLQRQYERTLQEKVSALLTPLFSTGIIANKNLILSALELSGAVTVRSADGSERQLTKIPFLTTGEAREVLESSLPAHGFGFGPDFDAVVKKLCDAFLRPNVVFDAFETHKRVLAAKAKIPASYRSFNRGEIIVRSGEVVTPAHSQVLSILQRSQQPLWFLRMFVGYSLLSAGALLGMFLLARHFWPSFTLDRRDLALCSLTLLGSLVLLKVGILFADSLTMSLPSVDPMAMALQVPLAAGGILLQVTLGVSSVFLFLFPFSLLGGIFLDLPLITQLLIFGGNVVGSILATRCRRRSQILVAGGGVAITNFVIVTLYLLLLPDLSAGTKITMVCAAVFGGLLSGVLAAGLTPVAEYIGGYVTDMKLLELASLDRPLLRELSLQAPGTWNHSMVIGQLCEVAAEAIGANSLLARVGAYYHDIGKAKKPAYFAENQLTRENRHDKLTPSMSALIIRAHVKDGIEMAREHRLPEKLIDFIPQHHGTSLISFFYDKALREAEEGEEVDESLYRYPGPKPQTKEAGILMLADGIEAASRALPDPTPAKIQGLVQKMINKVFASGQLDESELTLKDLHLIAKSFTRVLTGIFHRRVEYPENTVKIADYIARDGDRTDSETDSTRRASSSSSEGAPPEDPQKTLRRLGM